MSTWWSRTVHALRATAPLRVWGLVTGAFLTAWVAAVTSLPLYAGDSRYYAGRALLFGGISRADAYPRVVEYTARYHWPTPAPGTLFDYGLTAPRLLYPLLSAPFVRIFGIGGLAVVPTLSLIGLVVTLFVLASQRFGWRAALVPVLLVAASERIVYYCVAEITEGLMTFLSALILLVALRRDRLGTRRTLVWLVVLTVLMAFTRQATLVPSLAFAAAWFALWVRRGQWRNRWGQPALVVTVTTVVVQAAQAVVWPGFSQLRHFESVTGTHSALRALLAAPRLALHINKADIILFARQDRALLLLVVATLVSVVVLWRREETYLLIGGMAGAMVYNVTNGVASGFRYEMPALPYVVLSVAGLVAWTAAARRRRSGSAAVADAPTAAPQPARVASTTPMMRTPKPTTFIAVCRS